MVFGKGFDIGVVKLWILDSLFDWVVYRYFSVQMEATFLSGTQVQDGEYIYRSWLSGMNHLSAHIGYRILKWSWATQSCPCLSYRRHI